MLFLKKIIKSLGFSIGILLGLTLIITILNYIGIIGTTIVDAFSYITPFIALFIGGLLLGKESNNKGWLEGIKYGLICIVIFFIFNFLAFNQIFNTKSIILYIVNLIASSFISTSS